MKPAVVEDWLRRKEDFGLPTVLLDHEGKRLIACSRSFASMFAMITDSDLQRISLSQLFVDTSALNEWIAKSGDGESVRKSVAMRRFDGEVFVANCRLQIDVVGGSMCRSLSVYSTNIDEGSATISRYEAIFAAATVPMIVISESGIVENINQLPKYSGISVRTSLERTLLT